MRALFYRWSCSACSSVLRFEEIRNTIEKVMLDWTESLTGVMFKFTGIIMYFCSDCSGWRYGLHDRYDGLRGRFESFETARHLICGTDRVCFIGFHSGAAFLPDSGQKVFCGYLRARIPCICYGKFRGCPAKALTAMERFGVPRKIVSFVLPTGYSFNLDGSIFISLARLCFLRPGCRYSPDLANPIGNDWVPCCSPPKV